MAEVKWIKLMVGMFDGMSFKRIKRAQIGGERFRDKLTAVWFELLDLAGKCNHSGAFIEPDGRVFASISDLAVMIDRDDEELELCMSFFVNEEMVTYKDGVYMLTNWEEYQNVEGLDKIREQTRKRVKKHREQKKHAPLQTPESNVTCNVTVTHGNETERDKDKDKDKEIDIDKDINKSECIDTALTQATEVLTFFDFKFALKDALINWVMYKSSRGELYSVEDMKRVFSLARKYAERYDEASVIDIIETSMANGYKNIVFDRLDKWY